MKRNIESKLKDWKEGESRKPLVLRGARQVGKTYTINEFGKSNYKNYIRLDFEKESRLSSLFDGDLNPQIIFNRILLEKNINANPEDTLIFLDEIQLCPRALMSLRYFFEEMPNSHVIAAGSLLEFSLADASFPVGRVDFMWMFPMSFEEFLLANNHQMLIDHIPHYQSNNAVDEFVHNKLLECLKNYFIVGGMPEAVKAYVQTNSYVSVRKIHSNLCISYIEDFSKYHSKVDRFLLENIFKRVPVLVGKHLKYSHLADGRNEKIKEGFNVLQKSLVAYNVIATDGKLPLHFSSNEKIFKTLFLDIGLMQFLCDIPSSEILDSSNLINTYHGALAEQFVGQQLISTSEEYPKLYFWNRLKKSSQAELDYLIYKNDNLIPIEVKSTSSGSLKSLHLFLKTYPDIEKGFVFSNRNISEIKEQRIKFVPLYCKF